MLQYKSSWLKAQAAENYKEILFINRKHQVIDISDIAWYYEITEAKHGAVCSYRKASFLFSGILICFHNFESVSADLG